MDGPKFTLYSLPTSPALWDRVGVFFISYCAAWSTLVVAGMAFCWFNRHSPVLRLRGLPLSFTAIIFLHAYWILAQITYPIGRTIPVVLAYDIQYFFMGIWFPLGIALFHASNSRFLHVAKLQRQFTLSGAPRPGVAACDGTGRSWLCRLGCVTYTKRVMIFVGDGMALQVLLTVGMCLACRKYHPTFGIPGTELRGTTIPEQLADLGRGWEWWPSVLWQVVWTWIVAPVLLWKAWPIRDTLGWRTQTIGCCLSGLHATPMFLVASYVPAFERVNAYFTPSQWIHLSIMMLEIFTIFVPAFEVVRLWTLNNKAAATNARWESSSQTSTLRTSTSLEWPKTSPSSTTLAERGVDVDMGDELMNDRLLTMTALDLTLGDNPGPLQKFSALCDFSGENVAFLTRTADWKMSFASALDGPQRLEAYNRALDIYVDFVSLQDAEFPLNLSSQDLKRLESMFEKAVRSMRGQATVNPATPFDLDEPAPDRQPRGSQPGSEYAGEVPVDFGIGVFDHAQSHIKYLVLTNTWPKFVAEMRQRRRVSSEMGGSLVKETPPTEPSVASGFGKAIGRFSTAVQSMVPKR
ncbi:hypothetical protein DCS_06342 [Drechmeria coniospora]|uniref:Regulator of G protein signaling superfamily n=1 Tax=Drechmeria coniospora TaxID=98403 RepID=A0A151GBF9_DRECN|nr:hypothetical protein DCS_06342 [Drechmeria coniospora]KYK54384.1 hypothetical protein DCS_06342 [Drechmeria coniospora]